MTSTSIPLDGALDQVKKGARTQTRSSSRISSVERNPGPFLKGNSAGTRVVEEVMAALAVSDIPILLSAEAGTGKCTIARRIHEASRRGSREFRLITCKDVGPEHFDGRTANLLSCKGTVYLDEIASLSAAAQLSLLEILVQIEESGNEKLPCRLICGSASNLELEVRSGQFHEGLYYRIAGVCLRLPPLRHRKQDIPFFMDFFLVKFAQEFGKPKPSLSERTLQLFRDYDWPGNIQELADAAKAIVILGDETLAMGGLRAILSKSDRDHNGQISLREATRAASRETEKELIMKALTRTRWNRRRAAQDLRISYKALLYKLKQIGYTQSEAS
jgi:two-component system, NtrC family, response regulator AtoC